MSYLTEAAPASTVGGALETFEAPQLTVAAGGSAQQQQQAVTAHAQALPPGYEYALPHTKTIDLIGEEFVKKDGLGGLGVASMPNVVVVSGTCFLACFA